MSLDNLHAQSSMISGIECTLCSVMAHKCVKLVDLSGFLVDVVNCSAPTDPYQREGNNLNRKISQHLAMAFSNNSMHCNPPAMLRYLKSKISGVKFKFDNKMYEMIWHLLDQRSRRKHVIDEGM